MGLVTHPVAVPIAVAGARNARQKRRYAARPIGVMFG